MALHQRVALVTGGGGGLGSAIARALADAGAAVVVCGRTHQSLAQTTAAIKTKGGRSSFVVADVSETQRIAKEASIFGPPDILVNAAGANPRVSIEETTRDIWDATLTLNLTAPFFLAKELVPAMRQRGFGRIINIASLQSTRAFENGAVYGASKAGLAQVTRAMAQAWSKDGITANAIAPGFFKTNLTAAVFADAERAERLAQRTFIGRNGHPDDIHGLAVFLASDASSYLTGQLIHLDGGFTAS